MSKMQEKVCHGVGSPIFVGIRMQACELRMSLPSSHSAQSGLVHVGMSKSLAGSSCGILLIVLIAAFLELCGGLAAFIFFWGPFAARSPWLFCSGLSGPCFGVCLISTILGASRPALSYQSASFSRPCACLTPSRAASRYFCAWISGPTTASPFLPSLCALAEV